MRFLVVLASFSALIGLAVPAHADADSYLAELDQARVSHGDPADATNAGLAICQRLEKGDSFDTVVASETAAGYSGHHAGVVVGAAVENLCPDLVPALNQWLQNTNRDQPEPPPSRVPSYTLWPGEAG